MNNIEVIAFYLPQYHTTKENDMWYGKGFTEWTNVRAAQPQFLGHRQPIIPGELGYYNLRDAQVRVRQAELAREAGISAFCYYHYWFGNGRQMLETPLNEVVTSQKPDFPFCVCWANHTWYKKTWDADRSVLDKMPLLAVHYGNEDDWIMHFNTLLPIFKDKRYYRIDNKLVFVFYRLEAIPHIEQMQQCWQCLAHENGLPEFYFMSYVDDVARLRNKVHSTCEKKILCCKSAIDSLGTHVTIRKGSRLVRMLASQIFNQSLNVHDYAEVRHLLLSNRFMDENVVPTLLPNFDNTPRRGKGAMILKNATPEQFYLHCKEVFNCVRHKTQPIVFLKSWNEWGEGNYIEPDALYGKEYLNALKNAINEFQNSDNNLTHACLRILIVGSTNRHKHFAPFITEQANALKSKGIIIDYFAINKKGWLGYMMALFALKKKIRHFAPNIVHAHYGLSGVLATLQNKVPVVVTYHGSDINESDVYRYSRLAIKRSSWNIFVSQRTLEIVDPKEHYSLLPCGINIPTFPTETEIVTLRHNVFQPGYKHVLFAGAFDNAIKDPELAIKTIELHNQTSHIKAQLIELKGYTRSQVNTLMYIADALLLTSQTEGSPQVIKEAMACGCPIVSVDVGDVSERISGIDGCYVTKLHTPQALASLLQQALSFNGRTEACKRILSMGLTNDCITEQLLEIYKQVIKLNSPI
ncbi:MAG: glycoside hydrolase family 99-like domain-containing protein [Paludibacteraceae bacterium]